MIDSGLAVAIIPPVARCCCAVLVFQHLSVPAAGLKLGGRLVQLSGDFKGFQMKKVTG